MKPVFISGTKGVGINRNSRRIKNKNKNKNILNTFFKYFALNTAKKQPLWEIPVF